MHAPARRLRFTLESGALLHYVARMPTPDEARADAPIAPITPTDLSSADRLRAAMDILEDVVADRALLGLLTAEERMRLIRAAGHVFNPDNRARRRMVKANIRSHKAAKVSTTRRC